VPVAVAGVDSKLLDPRGAWANGAEYDKTAAELVSKFVENFAQFEDAVDAGVIAAAPKVTVAA
jgi:phosphoenolpyruvate carboxykinase (ATP)